MPRNPKLTSKAPKPLPHFASEAAERTFWESHDTTEYLDWSTAQQASMPNLKPSTQTISLRLPAAMLADLKVLANKRDVPYQSLLKMFLADRIAGHLPSWQDRDLRPGNFDSRGHPRMQPTAQDV